MTARLAIAPPTHYLLDLPDEVLCISIMHLKPQDVYNLRCTCQRIRNLIDNDALIWKKLMTSTYPYTVVDSDQEIDWKRIFRKRHAVQNIINAGLPDFTAKMFHKNDLSKHDADEFLQAVDFASSTGDSEFVADALNSVLYDTHPDRDLSHKYYVRKLIHFFKSRHEAFWKKLAESEPQPEEFYDYIEGLVKFAQWFQPHENVSLNRVRWDVHCIAVRTLEYLHAKQPNHPIFNEERLTTKENNFAKYLFEEGQQISCDYDECRNLLTALNDTFFGTFRFIGNICNYYIPNNSYVDKVLQTKNGIPITLCLLYRSVAAKLGILLHPVNNPDRFLLAWQVSDTHMRSIDCFEDGVQTEIHANQEFATPLEVFRRMVRNLLHVAEQQYNRFPFFPETCAYPLSMYCLELKMVLGENSMNFVHDLSRTYLQLNINQHEVIKIVNQTTPGNIDVARPMIRQLRHAAFRQLEGNKIAERQSIAGNPKLRNIYDIVYDCTNTEEFSKYAVGMVMRHRTHFYFCVIYGWDPNCNASDTWIMQMGVYRLSRRDKQPFYHVLANDGSQRYAADENLIPFKPMRINNPMVGKYFMEFDESLGYIPHNELSKKYPEDAEVQLSFQGSWKKPRNDSQN